MKEIRVVLEEPEYEQLVKPKGRTDLETISMQGDETRCYIVAIGLSSMFVL